MRIRNSKKTYKTGLRAESIARIFLVLKGYKIIASRLKTPVGEIDILALKNRTHVLIEVKYRKDKHTAMFAISQRQKQRLIKAAGYIMSNYGAKNIRFDAILLSGLWIKHITNAWGENF